MLYSVIMAGGSGKRFWPVSTKDNPKQFLNIVEKKSLIVQTQERVFELSGRDKIKVVTTSSLAEKIKSHGFKEENIIIEPKGMNTLYAIVLSAVKIWQEDKNALMLVLPSDHWISNKKKFLSTVKKGINWAKKGYLITYGIVPNRPETGYGYIEKGEELKKGILKVKRFTEKPNIKNATSYQKSGDYLWNSGIFMWKVDVIIEEVKKHQSQLSEIIDNLLDNPTDDNVKLFYETGTPISIDYGVMERSHNALVVNSNFIWDDVGAWTSLERIYEKTKDGNFEKGKIHSINCQKNIFFSDGGIIVAKNVDNMIVIHTKNATLIVPKSNAQEVKDIIKHIPEEYK